MDSLDNITLQNLNFRWNEGWYLWKSVSWLNFEKVTKIVFRVVTERPLSFLPKGLKNLKVVLVCNQMKIYIS